MERSSCVCEEPHTLENLVTHRSKIIWLSRDCPYICTPSPMPWKIRDHYYIGHPCYGLSTTVKPRYLVASIRWPGSGLDLFPSDMFPCEWPVYISVAMAMTHINYKPQYVVTWLVCHFWWLKVFGHLNEFEKELPDQIFILFTKNGHWIKKQYSTVYSAINIIIIIRINCTEIYDYSVEIILKFILLWFFLSLRQCL